MPRTIGLCSSDADELPVLSGSNSSLMVRFGAEQADFFARQTDGSYTAYYGSQDTLVHDTDDNLFVLTKPDGTVYQFYDLDQADRPQGAFDESIAPSGATVVVTGWTEPGVGGRIAEVQYETTPGGTPYQLRAYTYTTDGLDHIASITLQQYDANSPSGWDYVRQITYGYYGKYNGSNELFGLSGDLKTITTQQWDATSQTWTGDDTDYFRYYTTAGHEHELERALLPNAYASFVSQYGDPADSANSGDTQDDRIASFTCFYYTYDTDRRVSKEIVFGKSNESDYVTIINPGDYMVPISGEENSYDYNNWAKKSVETDLNHNTTTVYTNYIGQTLLTDLYDAASGNHTITYYRYDTEGHLILTAEPSAFQLCNGKYYDDSLPDLIDYATGSPYLSDTDGLFQETVYYASTSSGIGETTAGGVEGYVYETAVAHGETAARLAVGSQNGPILLSSYTYYAHTANGQTIYPTASYTTYSNEDGTGAAITSYAYTWYTTTGHEFQIQEERTTLPVVSTVQNGSGTAAATFAYYSSAGNLEWSADQNGRFTHYIYDSLTDHLVTTIADVDASDGYSLPTLSLTGWPSLPSSGVSAESDYQYDALGRVTQTLGPAHMAEIDGTMTNIRTASWNVYKDAGHETWTAKGYETLDVYGQHVSWTLVDPVLITKTDRDGRVTDQIQATWGTGPTYSLSAPLADISALTLASANLNFTAWSAQQIREHTAGGYGRLLYYSFRCLLAS